MLERSLFSAYFSQLLSRLYGNYGLTPGARAEKYPQDDNFGENATWMFQNCNKRFVRYWKTNFDLKIWRYFRKDHSFIYLYPGNSKFLIVCIAYHTFWKVAAIFTVISPPNSLISVGSKLFIPKLSHVFKTFFRCKLSLRGFSVNWFEKNFETPHVRLIRSLIRFLVPMMT